MYIKKISFFKAIQFWNDLYISNRSLSPYSSPEFIKIFNKTFYLSINRIKMKKIFYGYFTENHEIVGIIPLCYRQSNYHIFGDLCSSGYLDFIYKDDVQDKYFDTLFFLLSQKLKNKRLHLNKLNQQSLLAQYLLKNNTYEKSICVNINFSNDIINLGGGVYWLNAV